MTKLLVEEQRIVDSLAGPMRAKLRPYIRWAENLLDGTRYRLTIPSFSIPWMPGLRTAEQQAQLYARGRTAPGEKVTNADGVRRTSYHQTGMAVHLGLRYRRADASSSGPEVPVGRFIAHQSKVECSEARELFLLLVQEAERRGFTWGGRWRSLRDYHHFEIRD